MHLYKVDTVLDLSIVINGQAFVNNLNKSFNSRISSAILTYKNSLAYCVLDQKHLNSSQMMYDNNVSIALVRWIRNDRNEVLNVLGSDFFLGKSVHIKRMDLSPFNYVLEKLKY